MENGTEGGVDWMSLAAPAQAWGGNESMGGLDWSQPMVQVGEDDLKLDWGDEKEDDDEDDDEECLTMKKLETDTKGEGSSEADGSNLQREETQVGLIL